MKTPSKGLDQNKEGKFIDKYWGRIPAFLIYMPESFLCDINPEYLELFNGFLTGEISKDNLSIELYYELERLKLNMGCPCLLSGEERAILNAMVGAPTCPPPSHKLECGTKVCCNLTVSCKSLTVCTV